MQGWSPDFVPKLTEDTVKAGGIDQIITVANADAMKWSKELHRKRVSL